MPKSRAAYMREYRAKRKALVPYPPGVPVETTHLRTAPEFAAHRRIAELEEEVARLKRELAARPEPVVRLDRPPVVGGLTIDGAPQRNPYTEFRPAPKVRK